MQESIIILKNLEYFFNLSTYSIYINVYNYSYILVRGVHIYGIEMLVKIPMWDAMISVPISRIPKLGFPLIDFQDLLRGKECQGPGWIDQNSDLPSLCFQPLC